MRATIRDGFQFLASEATALQRSMVALLLAAVADLIAGLALGRAQTTLDSLPGMLVLIPGAIAMRGATFGALGARLGTAIHTGQFERDLRPGSWLWRQLETVVILTLVTSVQAGVLAVLLSRALDLETVSTPQMLTMSVVGGLLASVVLMVVVVMLARTAWARDWNMDDVGAPAITATGDLLAIPAILLASRLVTDVDSAVAPVIAWVSVVATVLALARGWLHSDQNVRTIVRESFVVLTFAATLSVIAGLVVESRDGTFQATPALLILFPPFIAMFGSLGGILSSRLASKLHLGAIEPRPWPERLAAQDILMVFVLSTGVFLFVGFATWALATGTGLDHPGLGRLVGVSVTGGLLGTSILGFVAYTAATATYRFGLDPDNHAIPIVTSTMDLLGMLCLVAALGLFNVAG